MKGHVYQRGKTYTYVIDLPSDSLTSGRRQKSKGGFKTEKEAWSACHIKIAEIEKGMHVDDSKITVKEYLEEYLETHAEPNFKPTSYDTEKTIIEARIIPVLGKIKLQALTPRTIKTFYAELRKKYSKEYVKGIHGVLKRALRLAYSESGLLSEDIMSKVSMRSKVNANEQKEMQFWTVEEFTHFLKSSKHHVHYIVFSLAIYTGMRRGEILGLRWRDIDFDNRELKVIQTVNWTRSGLVVQRPKTVDSIRRVKLFQAVIDDLQERYEQVQKLKEEYGDKYEDNDLVCCYPYGGYIKPKRITEGYGVLTKKAEIKKIRFHDLRHTHASFLLKIGINPKVAAERLGMTPAMFNERYSHLLPTMQDEAVDRIEAELNKYSEKPLEPVDN
ncbi:site-specific integrase [Paenibacillus sp. 79R4]|uniref:site-specific integrase n=1 Tax=Paenibacillus sp. 79R4 TaxID=2212847 RepID=UPI0015BB6360|nr:site-specific integrase [Paenibacillus sp. 79R4]NWL89616.1 site-specific integrase [Paenibacillus sp. 79R4]